MRLQWVRREFPGHFRTSSFMNVRTVDAQSYGGDAKFRARAPRGRSQALAATLPTTAINNRSCRQITPRLRHRSHRRAEQACRGRSTRSLADSIFFTSKLILKYDNWYIRQLHSEAALTMLRQLHLRDMRDGRAAHAALTCAKGSHRRGEAAASRRKPLTTTRSCRSVGPILRPQWNVRPASMTIVWPVMVSVRHMVTTMSAQSSLSAAFFRQRARRGALDLLGPEIGRSRACPRAVPAPRS